jgi:hypothetical protein
VQKGEWRGRIVGKAAGGEGVFIYLAKGGLAGEFGCNPMLDATDGEGGHRVAKRHGLVYRYAVNR